MHRVEWSLSDLLCAERILQSCAAAHEAEPDEQLMRDTPLSVGTQLLKPFLVHIGARMVSKLDATSSPCQLRLRVDVLTPHLCTCGCTEYLGDATAAQVLLRPIEKLCFDVRAAL